jgi:hypothetical protein
MISTLKRKAAQLAGDPVLCRWLMERALRLTPGEPAFTAHHPPYLAGFARLDAAAASLDVRAAELPGDLPADPLVLKLAGETVTVRPREVDSLFSRTFADSETLLSLHRFAFLPWQGDDMDPRWVQVLWQAWAARFGVPAPGWPWHPYTAAERAINVLRYGRRAGLPGPREATLKLLAAHGPVIQDGLEWFGGHHTSNHCANNGRGLYLLGRALGWEDCARLGLEVLLHEAARIFLPSGVLREDSSHYHVLLARNYASCWLAARGRPEEAALAGIAGRALAVIPHLALPGGLPLIGDISPDCPPALLAGMWANGAVAGLDDQERAAIAGLTGATDAALLAADGWVRLEAGRWAGLWHAAPEGWCHMPGHGHQDLGGFELHFDGVPLFIDAGRGSYGDAGEAGLYRSAAVHNLVEIDGADPYPPNRPYYAPAFRRRTGGRPPQLRVEPGALALVHHGYGRIGVPLVERRFTLGADRLVVADRVEGKGRHTVLRRFVTPWPVTAAGNRASMALPGGTVSLVADGELRLRPLTRWTAYGEGTPATAIEITGAADLPWSGTIIVERA